MKLPKKLKIGYQTYKVESWDRATAATAGRLGECDKLNAIIRVDDTFGPIETRNTFIHELLHACYTAGGLEVGDSEERIVTVLANQLCQVIQDNPELKFK